MTMHYESRDDFLFADSHDRLRGMGITLTTGTDFEVYREFLAQARPDHALGEPFEPTKYEITPENALWIIGRDDSGKIMHTQAMRRITLHNLTLGDYMKRNLPQFAPSGLDIDYSRSSYRPGPAARVMKGTLVYHGEFWVGGSARAGTVLSPMLGQHAFLVAMREWRPDYTFGFIAKSLAFKGFSARFGFMHNEPNAVRYTLADTGQSFEGTMGYMGREDLQYVMECSLAETLNKAA